MTAIRHHRRDLRIEARFLPESLDQAEQLRAVIRDAIASGEIAEIADSNAESMADSITGWLIGKRAGVDSLSAPTRSRYRRVLSALELATPGGGGDDGRARFGALGIAAVLASASAAAMSPSGAPAMARLALAPIIYDSSVMSPRAA